MNAQVLIVTATCVLLFAYLVFDVGRKGDFDPHPSLRTLLWVAVVLLLLIGDIQILIVMSRPLFPWAVCAGLFILSMASLAASLCDMYPLEELFKAASPLQGVTWDYFWKERAFRAALLVGLAPLLVPMLGAIGLAISGFALCGIALIKPRLRAYYRALDSSSRASGYDEYWCASWRFWPWVLAFILGVLTFLGLRALSGEFPLLGSLGMIVRAAARGTAP